MRYVTILTALITLALYTYMARPGTYNYSPYVNSPAANYNYRIGQNQALGPVNPAFQQYYQLGTQNKPSVLGASTGPGGYNPTTSGQAPTAGPAAPPPQDHTLDILRANFANARSGIENLNPQLDSTYNTSKGDIEASINSAKNTANTQKQDLTGQFGDILKNQLNTYQDLSRQRQGLFSSLGTLDSSAFGEQQFRADQSLADQRGRTELEQTKAMKSVDDTVNEYNQRAQSQLAQLATQYQAGKNAISQALSQNNINEASSIQDAMNQISQQAQAIQNNMMQWAQQAALLKGQGVDVMGALRGITGNDYASNVANQLGQARAFGSSLMSGLLPNNPQGQGFIGRSGKKYQDRQQAMLAGDA